MCGLAGSIGRLDDDVLAAVERMSAAERHRGPDAGATWSSARNPDGRGVVLAHRRLAIIDLSPEANQPMHDPETGNVLIFNGEIYGFRALRDELRAEGSAFRTRSDTEVVLRAYARWGTAAFAKLRGMFALALHDARRGVVVLARDRIGIKPLYVARIADRDGRGTVLFASEVRALLASGKVERKLSAEALATYAWNGFVNGDPSIVEGIRSLPEGSFVEVPLDGSQRGPTVFWSLPRGGARSVSDLREIAAELETAASQHLESDVPVGVFLSGGIDSSAVAALSTKAGKGPVHTFNIAFDDPSFDESKYAREVAAGLGTVHREIRLTESTFAAQLDAALGCLDQPSFDAINTYFVSRAVREAGITVALAGTGGDELFGGYRSYQEIPRGARVARSLGWAPRFARERISTIVARMKMGKPGAIPPQTRWGKLADALATRGDRVDLYQVSYGLFSGRFLGELVDEDLANEVAFGLAPDRRASLRALVDGEPDLSAIASLEIANFLGQRLLRDSDAASMAVSLELRVPLLDHVVIEEAAKLAEDRRFRPLGRKQVLRDVALAGLDPAIFDRPKSGFVLPIERWARAGMQREVADTLHDREACRAVGLVPEAVARLWNAFESGAPGIYWSRVWSVFALLRWSAANAVTLAGKTSRVAAA
jgi:asparagine synthase (glutamine-hydrolysing)